MLRAESTGKGVHVAASGSVKEVTKDVVYVIQGLYEELARSSRPELGEVFRDAISEVVNHPESPMWKLSSSPSPNVSGLAIITINDLTGEG